MKKKHTIKNKLNTDFKGSSLAADLIQQGLDINDIEIIPIGETTRAFSKEIKQLSKYTSEQTGSKRIMIKINRQGLYDMLPEGLFHTLSSGTEILDEDIMIEDIQNKRIEEKNARIFFEPFEIEIYKAKTLIETYENRLDMQTSFYEMSNLFVKNWNELQYLNSKQKVIWMHFIPEIQHHKNDLNYLERFLNTLINLPIEIKRKHKKRKSNLLYQSLENEFLLGKNTLGVNSITTQSAIENYEIIEITVSPSAPHMMQQYLSNEQNINIIKMTTDYIIPLGMEVEINYEYNKLNRYSTLKIKNSTTYLGITSYL